MLFFARWATEEGTLSFSIFHRGIEEGTLVVFFQTLPHQIRPQVQIKLGSDYRSFPAIYFRWHLFQFNISISLVTMLSLRSSLGRKKRVTVTVRNASSSPPVKNNQFWLPEKNAGNVVVMAGKHPLLALQILMEISLGVTQTLVGHF